MNTARIETLFLEYEKAFNNLDARKTARVFADTFISTGPKGTIVQSKKDFLEKAAQASEFYKSIGQTSAKICSKNIMPISDQYVMVTVHWGVTFEKTGDELIEFDITYIVQLIDEPRIILFIAHQDEEEAMKKLGLMEQSMS